MRLKAVLSGLLLVGSSATLSALSGILSPASADEPPEIGFGAALHFPTGDTPLALAVGDFNEDGAQDLAVAATRANSVGILLGRGDGTFEPPIPIPWLRPQLLAVADFNDDGHQDLVGSEFSSPTGIVEITFGQGDGTFGPLVPYGAGLVPSLLAVGDFTGDGLPDVAVGTLHLGVSVLLNVGAGALGGAIVLYPNTSSDFWQTDLVAADFDGDGLADLATASYYQPECLGSDPIGILKSLGSGSFVPTSPGIAPGCFPQDLALTDLDADGRSDLVVVSLPDDFLAVTEHRNLGGGAFAPPAAVIPVPDATIRVLATDFNRDGIVDLALGQNATALLVLRAGLADGTTGPDVSLALADRFTRMVSADFDGDGSPDLALSEVGLDSVAVYLSGGGPSNATPVAAAGADQDAECSSVSGAQVILDGSASTDADSTPSSNDDIVAFDWFVNFGGPAEAPLGSGEILPVTLPPGTHAITLRVTDQAGAIATDDLVVTVADTVAPVISAATTPTSLWPASHNLVPVHVTVSLSDACGVPTFALESVTSSEPDDARGNGDGSTTQDIQDAELGTPDADLRLRAERSASGTGRIYTLTYHATDGAGNETAVSATVVVPLQK